MWRCAITCLSKPIKCVTHRVNPNENKGLQLITVLSYWLINCNTCSTLVQDAGKKGKQGKEGIEGVFGNSLSFLLNIYEPKKRKNKSMQKVK